MNEQCKLNVLENYLNERQRIVAAKSLSVTLP